VTVILNDPDTKLPVCIADGTAVSAKRTGASGGIAARELSIRNASVMLICGAGAQARTQLEAIKLTRPTIRKVFVYDIRPESTAAFIKEMGPMYPDIEFVATDTPEKGAREADIVDCVTLADSPIIEADWIKPGALLMNMADFEMTYDCVRKSAKIVVDNWENVKHRMISTVALMARDGLVKDEDLHAEMGQILMGKKAARETDDEIIYFNAVGSGLMDIAVVTRCYRKALKEGLGVMLSYWE
jgi:ornithine cyclodeaminase